MLQYTSVRLEVLQIYQILLDGYKGYAANNSFSSVKVIRSLLSLVGHDSTMAFG